MPRPKLDPARKRRVISPRIRPDLIRWLQRQPESQAQLIEQALELLKAKREQQGE